MHLQLSHFLNPPKRNDKKVTQILTTSKQPGEKFISQFVIEFVAKNDTYKNILN